MYVQKLRFFSQALKCEQSFEQSNVDLTADSEVRESLKYSPIEHMHGYDTELVKEQSEQAGADSLMIERPRSALHSGDFRSEKSPSSESQPFLSTSPPAPWTSLFPRAVRASHDDKSGQTSPLFSERRQQIVRARAVSHVIFPQSFSLQPPTSPLVYQANSGDAETSRFPPLRQSPGSPDRANRRHSFSPRSFQTYHTSSMNTSDRMPGFRRSLGVPYQAHQPRRSASSMSTSFTPQTSFTHTRRPSYASDTSQLHHAPMVGSFEESILRGRMSTNPSRPLDFVAQIGVLGKDRCPSSLRCPPHVTIPFPAVFYSYGSGNDRIPGNLPSPYVGLVDIENSLIPAEDLSEVKQKRRNTLRSDGCGDPHNATFTELESSKIERRKRQKMKRRLTSPKTPPGGCYRIPQQGQIQIVIKNPNKTAVKLFLVPYDLSDMEPGQKTFIRQRSYSAGPIIDMPLNSRGNLGTDRPEASLSSSDEPAERPVLRYLIHLHICCPAKERFYLYKSIRVVFANRVLDGKERLRNEIQLPEPRYSSYKPSRDVQQNVMTAYGPSCSPALGQALRRCSAGSLFNQQLYNEQDTMLDRPDYSPLVLTNTQHSFGTPSSPVQPIPIDFPKLPTLRSRPGSRDCVETDSLSSSPFQDEFRPSCKSGTAFDERPAQCRPQPPWNAFIDDEGQTYEKLSRENADYAGSPTGINLSGTSCGPGLLTSRLKGLDVRKERYQNDLSG